MHQTTQAALAAGQAALLVGSALAAPVAALAENPATTVATAETTPAAVAQATANATHQAMLQLDKVEGTFSFNQQAVTSNDTIRNVFRGAVAALCSSQADYGTDGFSIDVEGVGGDRQVVVTEKTFGTPDKTSLVLGCTCAANIAGGGASINAEVEGVPFASIAAMAGAL